MSNRADPHEWLRFAHDDLAAARLLLTDVELPARMACFHAQQAADARYPADLPDITADEAAAVGAIADQIIATVGAALRANGPA